MTKQFRLSIITINFNNKAGLIKTVESVIKQTYKGFEYIVIDGDSTDGSKAYLTSMQKHFDFWVSEPDQGIYDAMNKGILIAKGEYLLFLNSGDYLINDDVLQKVFSLHPKEDILYGNLKSDYRDFIYPKKVTLATFFEGTIPHQASFIKRSLFDTYGLYDKTFPIIADWVFFLKVIITEGVSYRYYDEFISFFESDGISTQSELQNTLMQKRSELLIAQFPNIFPDYMSMHKKITALEGELNSYRNSRLIQFIRGIQKKILRTR